VNREPISLKEFERGTAALSGMAWDALATDEGEGGLQRLREAWPSARSFWWRVDDGVDLPAPHAEDWPPREELLLDWIGVGGDATLSSPSPSGRGLG